MDISDLTRTIFTSGGASIRSTASASDTARGTSIGTGILIGRDTVPRVRPIDIRSTAIVFTEITRTAIRTGILIGRDTVPRFRLIDIRSTAIVFTGITGSRIQAYTGEEDPIPAGRSSDRSGKGAAMDIRFVYITAAGLKQASRALHSYEVPCIVSIPVEGGNPDFLSWIAGGVRKTGE